MAKSLIKLIAPKNYAHKGEVSWINPDDASLVFYENQVTVVELRNGSKVFSMDTLDNVVKLINDNASHQ